MKINKGGKFAGYGDVNYKDKCVFVRSKIKEVINDIRNSGIPAYYALRQDIVDGRVQIEDYIPTEAYREVCLSIYKLEFICDILKKWYDTISKNVDFEMIGNFITAPILFILCDEDCITTTVNSLYIFFNTFDVTDNSEYTAYRFLRLCEHYCVCRNDGKYKHVIFNSKIYCENECKLLYYIMMISECSTIDEVKDIYIQAIKP